MIFSAAVMTRINSGQWGIVNPDSPVSGGAKTTTAKRRRRRGAPRGRSSP